MGELLCIKFPHKYMTTIGLYPEELDPEHFYFQCPGRNKIHCIYQILVKEENFDQSTSDVQILEVKI